MGGRMGVPVGEGLTLLVADGELVKDALGVVLIDGLTPGQFPVFSHPDTQAL
jgi:hypothetical protein